MNIFIDVLDHVRESCIFVNQILEFKCFAGEVGHKNLTLVVQKSRIQELELKFPINEATDWILPFLKIYRIPLAVSNLKCIILHINYLFYSFNQNLYCVLLFNIQLDYVVNIRWISEFYFEFITIIQSQDLRIDKGDLFTIHPQLWKGSIQKWGTAVSNSISKLNRYQLHHISSFFVYNLGYLIHSSSLNHIIVEFRGKLRAMLSFN